MRELLIWGTLIVLGAIALHNVALWAERRGWIYYRDRKASPGTASRAFLEMQSLLEPGRQQVIDSQRKDRSEEEPSGDPPVTGGTTGKTKSAPHPTTRVPEP